MAEEAGRRSNVLLEQLILEQLGPRREDDGPALAPPCALHREGDHRREIGERLADARTALELRDAAVLQDVDELTRELDLLLAHAVAGEVARPALGVGERRDDRSHLEGHRLLVARADREMALLALVARPARCRRRRRRARRPHRAGMRGHRRPSGRERRLEQRPPR